MNNNLIYDISDKPKTIKEWGLYSIQQVLAVFIATVLIANICKTPVDACLIGACLGTLLYQVITKFKSPMFISSCGATVSAVCGALAIGNCGQNYLAVSIGGLVIFGVYALFAWLIKVKGIEAIEKFLPAIIIGPITMVIGANLAGFIGTYVLVNGVHNDWGMIIALLTMIIVAMSSHYFKGFWKTIPFLIGLLFGYLLSVILTITGVAPIIDFTVFNNLRLISVPDFTFLKWDFASFNLSMLGQVVIMFVPVAICAMCEHFSDHKVLSNIIGTDLTHNPGLSKTLLGDGAASFLGTVVCGLPNTSYGEAIATTGFSRVASTKVISLAAIILGLLAFITPLQAFIQSIPSCVFGGCAMVLYGYIFASGLKTLLRSGADLENNKNLIIVSVIITIGVSGIFLFHESFAGVSLALVAGVILNLILKEKN